MKHGSYVVGIAAAAILLAACSSSSTTAGSTTAASPVSSGAVSSSAVSSSAAQSSATSSRSATSSAASSAAGSATATVEVDAQTAAWFDTFCTGVAVFGELGKTTPTNPQELGEQLTTVGTTFTDTATKLSVLPPPTFEGGDELAQQLVTNMQTGGPVFTEFGEKAALLDPNNQAAGQQFQAEFQAAVANLGIANFEPTPAAREAVKAVPACQVLGS